MSWRGSGLLLAHSRAVPHKPFSCPTWGAGPADPEWSWCCTHTPSNFSHQNWFPVGLLGDIPLPKHGQKCRAVLILIGNAGQVPAGVSCQSSLKPAKVLSFGSTIDCPKGFKTNNSPPRHNAYNWSLLRHPPSYLIKPFKSLCILFIGAVKNPRTRYKDSFILFYIAL